MTKASIECFYFKLYQSVLLNDFKEARTYYEIIKDEYSKNEDNFEFFKEDDKWDILIKLIETVKNNLSVKNFDYENKELLISEVKAKNEIDYEKNLVKLIFDQKLKLAKLLNASSDFCFYNLEHPTRFGNVDLVCQDQKTMYVIELKRGIAKHDVIGQIDKYLLDFRLKLNLKIWNKVKGVIIANGFSMYILNELVKNGIIPIKYTLLKDNTINFSLLTGAVYE